MNDTCKNCGGWKGLHHWRTNQCPAGGREALVGQKQEWMTTHFEAVPNYEEMIRRKDMQIELLTAQGEASRKVVNALREIIRELVFHWEQWENQEIAMKRTHWRTAKKEAAR